MNWKTKWGVWLAACSCAMMLGAQEADEMQKPLRFEGQITRRVKLDYLLYFPKDYKASEAKKWPLLLFLHGAGERGSNVWKVAVHGPPKLVRQKKDFPFIIVSPQCPDRQTWDNDILLALLDDVIAKHKVDTNRIYLTGLSMGGYGTWSLGISYPEKFAAIAPICGGGDTIKVKLTSRQKGDALKSLGVWAFHGGKDPTVKLEESERMVAELKSVGCTDVKLTVYPEAGHDSWTESYNNPQLFEWFLQ